MSKTLTALCALFFITSILVVSATFLQKPQNDVRWLQNVEALVQTENPCLAGGPGASECELDLEPGNPTGMIHCHVSCRDVYYACCTVYGCHCIRY